MTELYGLTFNEQVDAIVAEGFEELDALKYRTTYAIMSPFYATLQRIMREHLQFQMQAEQARFNSMFKLWDENRKRLQ